MFGLYLFFYLFRVQTKNFLLTALFCNLYPTLQMVTLPLEAFRLELMPVSRQSAHSSSILPLLSARCTYWVYCTLAAEQPDSLIHENKKYNTNQINHITL